MQYISCSNCNNRFKVRQPGRYKCTGCGNIIDFVDITAVETSFNMSDEAAPPSQKAPKESSLRSFSLRTKFNLAMSIVFICCVAIIYVIAGNRLHKEAEQRVFDKARLLLTTMESSRKFTSKVIKPALYKALPDRFIPEGMSSSFGARNIFNNIRKIYPDYYFKHAAPYPRNLINQADAFEMDIIQKFNNNSNLKVWEGYRQVGLQKNYSIMKPIVAKDRCMRCHSTPNKAPKELLERYGKKNGFGRKIGEVIGTLTVSVPASVVLVKAKKNTYAFIGMVAIFFVVLTLIFNIFFSRMVLSPIKRLADNANEISLGKMDTQIDTSGNDEIGKLANAFDRMKISIKMALNQFKS